MSNPLLTTTHSKLDTRVKEPSGVGSTPDRFNFSVFSFLDLNHSNFTLNFKSLYLKYSFKVRYKLIILKPIVGRKNSIC